MRDALPPSPHGAPRYGFRCQCCGQLTVTDVEGLFANPTRGSTQRFCSPACRQAAYRRRRVGATETQPRQHTGGRSRGLTKDQQNQEVVNFQLPPAGQNSAAVDKAACRSGNGVRGGITTPSSTKYFFTVRQSTDTHGRSRNRTRPV